MCVCARARLVVTCAGGCTTQRGRQAGGRTGRRRPRRGEVAVAVAVAAVAVAASSREAGPAGNPEPVAAPHRGPGVRGQALPPRPCTGRLRDTPPSFAFLFHLLLFILPSLLLSLLPISPPLLPLRWLSGSPSTLSSPAPPLLSLSPPPACFPVGAEGLRTPGPSLLQGRAGAPGGRGEGVAPSPPPSPPLPHFS